MEETGNLVKIMIENLNTSHDFLIIVHTIFIDVYLHKVGGGGGAKGKWGIFDSPGIFDL